MSNIYLKVPIEKNFVLKTDFQSGKSFSSGQFWGAPTHADITEF